MNAKEFIEQNGCEHDGSFVPISEVYKLMESYASQQMPSEEESIKNMDMELSINMKYDSLMSLSDYKLGWADCFDYLKSLQENQTED